MPIAVVCYALLAFLILFGFQIVISRLMKPRSEDKFIIALFVLLPIPIFLFFAWNDFFGTLTLTQGFLAYILFFVLASSWVASYPAIYAVCPSLIMSYVIEKNQKGTSLEEIRQLLQLKQNSVARIDDAVNHRWIEKTGDKLQLTGYGRTFLRFFQIYRRILGLNLDPL